MGNYAGRTSAPQVGSRLLRDRLVIRCSGTGHGKGVRCTEEPRVAQHGNRSGDSEASGSGIGGRKEEPFHHGVTEKGGGELVSAGVQASVLDSKRLIDLRL